MDERKPPMKIAFEQRFWDKVNIRTSDECWEWIGGRERNRYGKFQVQGSKRLAHRICWELEYGPIPPKLCVLHSCDNPPCCNPEHLFLGTHLDNMQDCVQKGRALGELSRNHKLTEVDVLEIRRLSAIERLTQHAIVGLFPITSRRNISDILTRKTWVHI